jgi:hypothetical protein
MNRANVNDPHTVENLYPREAFEHDAARNALDKGEVIYGIRIDSSPDEQGWFDLVRAQRHVGELSGSKESMFLSANQPHLSAPVASDPDERAQERPAPEIRRKEYESFIDAVIKAARTVEIPGPIGREEMRLKGLRGG